MNMKDKLNGHIKQLHPISNPHVRGRGCNCEWNVRIRSNNDNCVQQADLKLFRFLWVENSAKFWKNFVKFEIFFMKINFYWANPVNLFKTHQKSFLLHGHISSWSLFTINLYNPKCITQTIVLSENAIKGEFIDRKRLINFNDFLQLSSYLLFLSISTSLHQLTHSLIFSLLY